MRRSLNCLTLLGVALFLRTEHAVGCGDKVLVMGRGLRYASLQSHRPASILTFGGAGSNTARSLKDPRLVKALKKAGHKFQSVTDSVELRRALLGGRYDLVIVDLVDAAAIEQILSSAAPAPSLLPISAELSKAQLADAQKRYDGVLGVSATESQTLLKIDEVMKKRAKRASQQSKSAKS